MPERRALGCLQPKTGIALLAGASLCSNVYLGLLFSSRRDEDPSSAFPLVLAALRASALLGVAASLVGLYGVIHENMPCLRFFSIQQLFEISAFSMAQVSFALLAMSRLSGALGRTVCSFITTSSQDDVWTLNILDGLENCEERWQLVGVAFLLLSFVVIMIKAHLLTETWVFYRYLLRRQTVLGKVAPLSIEPSWTTSKRHSRSHTFSHESSPRPFLVQSPYLPSQSSPPSSPISANPSRQKRSRTLDGCQRRSTHASQPSDSRVLIYAPILMSLDEAKSLHLPQISSSPRAMSPASPSSPGQTAFPLFKSEAESDRRRPMPLNLPIKSKSAI